MMIGRGHGSAGFASQDVQSEHPPDEEEGDQGYDDVANPLAQRFWFCPVCHAWILTFCDPWLAASGSFNEGITHRIAFAPGCARAVDNAECLGGPAAGADMGVKQATLPTESCSGEIADRRSLTRPS